MGPEGQMLRNGDRKTDEAPAQFSPPPTPIPPGCVERILSMRDRNLIVGACVSYCAKEGKRKVKEQVNLERVKRLFRFEETVEYFALMNDAVDDAKVVWDGARKKYRVWLALREGALKVSDVVKEYPTFDLDVEPMKPSPVAPKIKAEELVGPTSTFHIPAKLDVWISDALRDMEWPTEKVDMTEGAAELARKFDLAEKD